MIRGRRIATGVLAVALIGALAVPATAGALGGRRGDSAPKPMREAGEAQGTQQGTRQGNGTEPGTGAGKTGAQRDPEKLAEMIANRLRARKARFDAVRANIIKRMARVEGIMSRLEAAGGDATQGRLLLAEAKSALQRAEEKEAIAIAEYTAVMDAPDKRAAFKEAREASRAAVAELKQTRVKLREAARELREEIKQLRDASREQSGTPDAQ